MCVCVSVSRAPPPSLLPIEAMERPDLKGEAVCLSVGQVMGQTIVGRGAGVGGGIVRFLKTQPQEIHSLRISNSVVPPKSLVL